MILVYAIDLSSHTPQSTEPNSNFSFIKSS
jgi:hypothetical protein